MPPVEWQVVEAAMAGVDAFSDAGKTMPTQLARVENVRMVRPGGFVPRTGFALIDNRFLPQPYSTAMGGTALMNPVRLVGRAGEVLSLGALRAASYTGSLRLDVPGAWDIGSWSEKGRTAAGTLERIECHAQNESITEYTILGNDAVVEKGFASAGNPKFADTASNGSTYLVVWTDQDRIVGTTGVYTGLTGGHEIHYQLRNVSSRVVARSSASLAITPGADRPDGVLAKCIAGIGVNGTGYVIVCAPRSDATGATLTLTPVDAFGDVAGATTVTGYGAGVYGTTPPTHPAVWDVCEVPGADYFLLAFSDSDLKMTVQKRKNLDLSLVAAAQFDEQPTGGLCVYSLNDASGSWLTYSDASANNRVLRLTGTLTAVGGFPFEFLVTTHGIDHSGIVQISGTVAMVVVDFVNAADTQEPNLGWPMHRVSMWGVIDQNSVIAWNPATRNPGSCQADMWLASRPWLVGGTVCCAFHHDDVENGIRDTGFVYRLYDATRDFGDPGGGEPTTARHIMYAGETVATYHQGVSDTPARASSTSQDAAAAGVAAGWAVQYGFDDIALSDRVNCLSHVVTFGDLMPTWAAVRTQSFIPVETAQGLFRFDAVTTAIDLVRIVYLDTQVFSSAEFGNVLFIAGPVPQIYDGVNLFEYPFQTAGPELRGLSDIANSGCLTLTGAASSLAGTYQYAACWRYTDALGNVYRSAPSQIVPRVLTNADGITIRTAGMPAGALPPAAFDQVRTLPAPMAMEVYRSEANLAELRFLRDALPTDAVPSAASFVDDGTGYGVDSTLALAPQLYTNSGEVANEPPPACKHVCAHKDRLWLATGESRLFFSKLRVAGRGPEFSSAFYVDLPEAIHATASLDSTLVAFGESSIFLVLGEGPDNNGGGVAYGYQRLPGTVTTHAPATITSTPAGVMFLACKRVLTVSATLEYLTDGFYILNRAYQIKKIGAPLMREFTGHVGQNAGPLVANSVCRTGATEVAWMMFNTDVEADSLAYVYDWGLDQWYMWRIKIPRLVSLCEGISRGQIVDDKIGALSIRRLFACGESGDYWQDGAQFDQPTAQSEPVSVYFPIVLEGLVRLGKISGFQRARKFILHARTVAATDEIGGLGGTLVSFAFDRDAELDDPNYTETHQSTSWQSFIAPALGLPGGYPQEFRFARQKCSVLKWRIETLLPQFPAMVPCTPGPYAGLSGQTLEIIIDAGTPLLMSFGDDSTTSQQIVDQITAAMLFAGIPGEAVLFPAGPVIRSFSEGSTASVEIVAGTAMTTLGLIAGVTLGVDAPTLPPQIYGVGLELGMKRGIVKLPAGQRAE